jgi:hypothetical protein
MSLQSMAYELTGRVPNLDIDLAVTMTREAWHSIRKLRGWSFQFGQGGFSVPSQIGSSSTTPPLDADFGTCTVAFGSPTVTGDAIASAEWVTASQYGSLLTQRQFRIGGGTIYNIIAADFTDPNAATLTLDRAFIDPLVSYTGQPYLIYQPYIPTPEKDFIRWLAVRDMTNVRWLNVNADYQERRNTDMADPQRQIYTPPLMVLPFETDFRPGSSTYGYFLYELYPQPISQILYQTWWLWEGPDLQTPTDILPTPITEALVKWKALTDAFANAEANKDPANPRGAGANFQFLSQFYEAKYEKELKACRINDRERVNLFNAQMTRVGSPAPFSTFNPATGVLSVSNLAQTS